VSDKPTTYTNLRADPNQRFTTYSHNASTGEYDIYSTCNRKLLISGITEDTTLPRKIEEAIRHAEKIAYKEALDDAKRAINNI
jgi:uncharacterized protein (UPF0147 family)